MQLNCEEKKIFHWEIIFIEKKDLLSKQNFIKLFLYKYPEVYHVHLKNLYKVVVILHNSHVLVYNSIP